MPKLVTAAYLVDLGMYPSRVAVWHAVRRGTLPFRDIRRGGRMYFNLDDVLAYIGPVSEEDR